VHHRIFLGDRARVRAFAAQIALDHLRRRCSGIKLASELPR
jgi:hypothetical protein